MILKRKFERKQLGGAIYFNGDSKAATSIEPLKQ